MKLSKTKIKNLRSQFLALILVTLLVLLPISVLTQENTDSTINQNNQTSSPSTNPQPDSQSQRLAPDVRTALGELAKSADVPSVGPDRIPTMITASSGALKTVSQLARSNRNQPDDVAVDTALRGVVLPAVAAVFRLTPNELQLREVRQVQSGEENEKVHKGNTMVAIYRQVKDGLEVIGGELAVVINQAGEVTAISSTARGGQNLDATPVIGENAAKETALEYASNSRPEAQVSEINDGQLTYVLTSRDYSLHLAYVHTVTGTSKDGLFADRIYTDADTNQVVAIHALIHSALNRQIYSAEYTFNLPGVARRFEGQPANADQTVNVNYDFLGVTYNWYQNLFGRDSYDNQGARLRSSVHVGNSYVNAFWDSTLQQFAFGDGDGWQSSSLAYSLDVTAHEVTHAVTEHSSNLVYQNEPGALNEAWSDIFGAVIEARQRLGPNGYDANTWKIGEDVWTPNTPSDALRYMDNPTFDGYSRDFYPQRLSQNCTNPNPYNDYCGVHGDSGIANLAFKLVVTGGQHPRGQTNVQVDGIGIDKARQIFYRANAVYLRWNSNFEHARASTAQAATDLYGECQAEYVAVQRAWDAVGVPGTWDCDGGGGGDIHFFTYGNGVYDWHGAGCYDVAQSVNQAANNFRFQVDAVPFAPNPGTSVAQRIGFTFPETNSPHTVILSRTAPHIQLKAPLGGGSPDTTVSITNNPNQSTTWWFREIGGAKRVVGTIVMFRHGNNVFEYSAETAAGTSLRAVVTQDVVVDAYLKPGWNQSLRGLAGVFPAEENLLSRNAQPFSIHSLRTSIGALNEFATSWACQTGQSLFEAPTPPAQQPLIPTLDPNAIFAAEQACEAAGVPRSDADRFGSCVFDVVIGGAEMGQMMASHAGAVSTILNQSPPSPGPDPCSTTELRAQHREICHVIEIDVTNPLKTTLLENQPLLLQPSNNILRNDLPPDVFKTP